MITKKCRQCGKEFTLTDGEIDFFKSKGLELPNRCAECRKKNKAARNAHASDSKKRPISVGIVVLLILALAFGYGISQINSAKLSNNDVTDIGETISTAVTEAEATAEVTETSTVTEAEATAEVTETSTVTETETTAEVTETSTVTETETTSETTETSTFAESAETEIPAKQYCFRNSELLNEHYKSHGIDMGFASAEEYEKAAAAVIDAPGVLHKYEKEDNDDVYYLESTNEIVIVSTDGFIRTYFKPDRGKDYFDEQ